MLGRLSAITEDLNSRFPDGNEPFQIMTRLVEECGELAEQVNHFQGTGIKRSKLGEPDRHTMAKEVKDVIRSALQIALYYGIQAEVAETFKQSYRALPPAVESPRRSTDS